MLSSKEDIDLEILTVAIKPRIGGMTAWFDQIAHGISSRGWKVRLLAFTDRVEGYEEAPFEVVHIPLSSPSQDRMPLIGKWKRWNRVEQIWREKALSSPRLRISDGTPGVLDFAQRISGVSSVPWVVVMGGDIFAETRSMPLSSILHRKIRSALSRADRVIVDGQDLRAVLDREGISEERIEVQYHGVDLRAYREAHSSRSFFPEKSEDPLFRVAWHGRLAEHHGPLRFIEVAKQIPDTIARFAGGGEPSKELAKMLDEHAYHDWFLGCLSSQDLIAFLREADCGVYPLMDMAGVPSVLLESMAVGLATVTLRTGACEELIQDGDNGFIVDGIPDMVECVKRLQTDSNLRKEVGLKAQETIEANWSTESSLTNLSRTLEGVLEK